MNRKTKAVTAILLVASLFFTLSSNTENKISIFGTAGAQQPKNYLLGKYYCTADTYIWVCAAGSSNCNPHGTCGPVE